MARREATVTVRCPRCKETHTFLRRAFNINTGSKEALDSCAVVCSTCGKVHYVDDNNIVEGG